MATRNVMLLIMAVIFMVMLVQETRAIVGDGLLSEVSTPTEDSGNKITIVGAGSVGMAVAFSLLTQFITDEIALVDRDENKVRGELLDLQHGSGFIKSPKIEGGTDYAITKNSKICIVTAGARQEEGEDRLALLQKNLAIFKQIIPKLVEYSPNAILLIVSNPVDILTYVAWKLSKLDYPRVIGSGTNLDSSRLRFLISQQLGIAPESVAGWVIGEHGDTSVPVWSGVNVAGVNLRKLSSVDENIGKKMVKTGGDGDVYDNLFNQVKNSAYEIIRLKKYTSWAVGLSVSNLCYSILHNVHKIHAVSTMVKGQHDIDKEVFLSLPCVLGDGGVSHIIKQPLDEKEIKQLQSSSEKMYEVIQNLKW